jgi:hypothetical protein
MKLVPPNLTHPARLIETPQHAFGGNTFVKSMVSLSLAERNKEDKVTVPTRKVPACGVKSASGAKMSWTSERL